MPANLKYSLRLCRSAAAAATALAFALAPGGLCNARAQTLAPPARPIADDFGPVLQTIPFELKDNHILVEVRVFSEGQDVLKARTLHFIWDTGFTVTALSKEAMDAYKIDLKAARSAGPKAFKGIGSASVETRVFDASIRIDDIDAKLELLVVPLGTDIFSMGIDGAIGGNILQAYVFEIDYENHRIRLYDRKTFKTPELGDQFITLPLTFSATAMPVTTANATPYGFSGTGMNLGLDTGDPGAITLYGPFVSRNKWQDALGFSGRVILSGAGGRLEQRRGRMNKLQFGGATLSNLPVIFTSGTTGVLADPDHDGQLGTDVLSRFTLIFDYEHKVLYLRPNSLATKPFPSSYTFGFVPLASAERSTGVSIAVIKPGGSFAAAGLLVGDKILSIDGRSVLGMSDAALSAMIQETGKPRVFEIGRGGERLTFTIKPIAY